MERFRFLNVGGNLLPSVITQTRSTYNAPSRWKIGSWHIEQYTSQWQCQGHNFWPNLGTFHDPFFTHRPQLRHFFTVSGGWPILLKGIIISFYLTPFCWKQMNLKFSWTCLALVKGKCLSTKATHLTIDWLANLYYTETGTAWLTQWSIFKVWASLITKTVENILFLTFVICLGPGPYGRQGNVNKKLRK